MLREVGNIYEGRGSVCEGGGEHSLGEGGREHDERMFVRECLQGG